MRNKIYGFIVQSAYYRTFVKDIPNYIIYSDIPEDFGLDIKIYGIRNFLL